MENIPIAFTHEDEYANIDIEKNNQLKTTVVIKKDTRFMPGETKMVKVLPMPREKKIKP